MKAVRNIQHEGRPSYLKNKLKDALQHANEWEDRDIKYYELAKKLEKNKIMKENKKQYSRDLDVDFTPLPAAYELPIKPTTQNTNA